MQCKQCNAHLSFFKPCCKGKVEVIKDTQGTSYSVPCHSLVLAASSTATHLNKVPTWYHTHIRDEQDQTWPVREFSKYIMLLLLPYFSGDCNFPVQLLSVSIRKYNHSVILQKISLILLPQYLPAGIVRH